MQIGLKNTAVIFTMLVLAACIAVKDVAGSWEKAVIDPALEGKWLMTAANEDESDGPHYIVFKKENTWYRVISMDAEGQKDEGVLRTVQANGHAFALLVDPDNLPAGKLWPYMLENDHLRVFTPAGDEAMEIQVLDAAALAALAQNFENPSGWVVTMTGEKVK